MADRSDFGHNYWRIAGSPCDGMLDPNLESIENEDFRCLADNLPTLCWIARADGYIVWYNERWHGYCGTTPEAMEGWGWQSVHDPHVLPKVLDGWTKAIASGEPFEMTFPLRGADGKFRPFLTRIVPLRDDAGVIKRWFGNNVDISNQHEVEVELRHARDELRELNRTLERRVSERSKLYEDTQEQLRQSQKLEAVGQLTGGVAHDFNNLLTVIRGSVDLLKREDLTREKRDRYIDAIGTTADRAAKLTGQLLAFARRQSLKPTTFDAGVSLKEVADMLTTLAGSRIQLKVHVPKHDFFIYADRNQFDTAIINMGLNARDAMDGTGTLTISAEAVAGRPRIRGHEPVIGDYVAITIADTGCGMSPELLAKVFEPFFTTKPIGQGTGLGLSQVFGFAKQSGGDVLVESRPGAGSTFTLYLPRALPVANDEAAEIGDCLPVEGQGTCVLIVEDNADVGSFATEALRELGYDSVLAIDGPAALATLGADSDGFHVVFSDVVMPGMSGLELAEEIRRLHPSMPVVLTSGYSHVLAENGQHGFELLHKPYSIDELSSVLRKAMHWRGKSA